MKIIAELHTHSNEVCGQGEVFPGGVYDGNLVGVVEDLGIPFYGYAGFPYERQGHQRRASRERSRSDAGDRRGYRDEPQLLAAYESPSGYRCGFFRDVKRSER